MTDFMTSATAKRPSMLLRYGGFAASVGTTRILGLVITSITFPILVRRLGVETYGQWSYIIALCAFLEVIANPGLSTYITQQVSAKRHAAAGLVSDFIALRLFSVIIAITVLFVIAHFEGRPDLRALLWWYGLASLCIGLTASDSFLTSLELFHSRSLLGLLQQSLYAAGVLTLVHKPKDLLWVPISILASAFVMNAAGWVVLWKNGFRPSLAVHPSCWRGILSPSLHYAATTMMATVYHRTGHLVVRWFLGDYALGLYAASVRFVDLLRGFVGIPVSVLMPRMALAAESGSGLRRLVDATVSAVAAVAVPLTLGTIATAHLVVPLIMGKGYAAAIGPVRLVSGLLIAGPMASLLSGTVLYALGRYRAYLGAAAAGAISAILLSLALVRVIGLPGVCIAFVLAEAVVAITAYFLVPHELRDFWKNPMIPVAALSAVLMVAGVQFANSYSSQPFIVVSAGVLTYLAFTALLGRKLLMQQFGGAR
jgi:O-antigen/teichoic acid export membrane protein